MTPGKQLWLWRAWLFQKDSSPLSHRHPPRWLTELHFLFWRRWRAQSPRVDWHLAFLLPYVMTWPKYHVRIAHSLRHWGHDIHSPSSHRITMPSSNLSGIKTQNNIGHTHACKDLWAFTELKQTDTKRPSFIINGHTHTQIILLDFLLTVLWYLMTFTLIVL